tara:strand:+ start:805 stop:1146 length:342 start_codon:yes stop_codon:yes gene_type:complete
MNNITSAGLNFSDSAVKHFLKALSNRGYGEGIKLGIKKAGCSGYEYTFDFVDDIIDDYITFEKNGCKIFVDSESFNFLKGSLIDYQDDGLNKGIKFVNPNAKAVCGCGESFTI